MIAPQRENIFELLGFAPDVAKKHLFNADSAIALRMYADSRGWSAKELAADLGIPSEKACLILDGKIQHLTSDDMAEYLVKALMSPVLSTM